MTPSSIRIAVFPRSAAPVPSKSRAPVSQSRPSSGAGAAINAGNLCVTSLPPFLLSERDVVLGRRRPRTVLGRLVGRAGPVGRRGLPPPGWLPLGLAGPAVPGRSPGHGRSGGSSPAAGPLAAAGHTCPSPRPVAERTPADHHGGRMMAAGRDRISMILQGGEPVLAAPPGRIGGIDDDHREPGVGGHLGQAVPEFPGGDTGDQPPEAPTAPAA